MKQGAQDGVSLVELVVAVLILSIAVIGLFRVFDQAAASVASNRDRQIAGLVARNVAEGIRLGIEIPVRTRFGGQEWQIEAAPRRTSGGFDELIIRVAPAAGGPGAVLTTYRAPDAS